MLVGTCVIVVLPLLDRLPILGWNEISRYLGSLRPAIGALGILTGIVVEYWLRKIVGSVSWKVNPKLHWTWLGVVGLLMVMGVGLPYLSMVAGTTGVRSIRTAGVELEFGRGRRSVLGTLSLEFERHGVEREQIDHFVNAPMGLLEYRLSQDIDLYNRVVNTHALSHIAPPDEAKGIVLNLVRARQFSMAYLWKLFECLREARDLGLDNIQTIYHSLPLGHGLRQLLAAGRTFVQQRGKGEPDEVVKAVKALNAGARHAAATFCTIAGRDPNASFDETWSIRPVEEIVTLSAVPHLYTFLAWLYMAADEMETALEVLEEADRYDVLVAFKNDMNYNLTRGQVLYFLEFPIENAIRYQERAASFANSVIESVPKVWPDGESARTFALRFAAAQRLLRHDLALLLAQQEHGNRIAEAVDYARRFFEETGHWERPWRWGMQWRPYSALDQKIKVGRFDDWTAREIYWLPADSVISYMVYGYVLMALGAKDPEGDIETLQVAHDLFAEGMEVYMAHETDLRRLGQREIYLRLEAYLRQAKHLLKETERLE